MASKIPLITLEEHYISQAVLDYYAQQGVQTAIPEGLSDIISSLREVGPRRLKAMDLGGVSLQVISHRPNSIPIPAEVCTAANDELFQAISSSPSPKRFAAFAMLPTLWPEAAAQELERCVTKLDFVGSLVDNETDGRFYDDTFFWPIFAAHERLDVPVYLHAAPHAVGGSSPFQGNYAPQVSAFLANHGFSWHSEVGVHVLRLFASRLFDTHPQLKVLLGHMGETLPFLLDRLHRLIQRTWPAASRPQRHLMQVWHSNIYLTTAGMFSLAPMACLIHTCCADKVLYSVDYPFCSHADGLRFMHQLRESGMINDQDFLSIAHKNAERLLGLRVAEEDIQVGMDVDYVDGDRDVLRTGARNSPWLATDGTGVPGDGAYPYSPLETVKE